MAGLVVKIATQMTQYVFIKVAPLNDLYGYCDYAPTVLQMFTSHMGWIIGLLSAAAVLVKVIDDLLGDYQGMHDDSIHEMWKQISLQNTNASKSQLGSSSRWCKSTSKIFYRLSCNLFLQTLQYAEYSRLRAVI